MALALLGLLACSGGAGTTPDDPVVSWRGASVFGHRAADAPAYLDTAYALAESRYGLADPTRLRIELYEGLVPCPQYPTGCGGTFESTPLRLRATWSRGTESFVAILEHEFCHFIRWQTTGTPLGEGCQS